MAEKDSLRDFGSSLLNIAQETIYLNDDNKESIQKISASFLDNHINISVNRSLADLIARTSQEFNLTDSQKTYLDSRIQEKENLIASYVLYDDKNFANDIVLGLNNFDPEKSNVLVSIVCENILLGYQHENNKNDLPDHEKLYVSSAVVNIMRQAIENDIVTLNDHELRNFAITHFQSLEEKYLILSQTSYAFAKEANELFGMGIDYKTKRDIELNR